MSTADPTAAPGLRSGDPHLRLEGGAIASVVFHAASGANVLGTRQLARLDAILAELEHGIAVGGVAAVVVRSGRPGSWLAGADLRDVAAIRSADEGTAIARRGQAVLRRLEQLSVPTFAAVDGACLGAGAELALACSYRLASYAAGTAFGFPEVRYGLLPALGGTVRLPRLIGARAALELVLTGRPVDGTEAREIGLADEAYPAADFDARVLAFVRERMEKGRRRTGARRGVARRLVEDTAPGRRALFARVRRGLVRGGGEHNPAGLRALDVVARGLGLPLDEAFAAEAEAFGALAVSPQAHALTHAFSLRRIARRPPGLPDVAPARVETVALLGGGAPAGALGHLLASHGISVRIRDRDRTAVGDAVRWVREAARWEQRQGDATVEEAAARVDRVSGAQGFGGFGTVDLALELAVGDEARKRALLAEAESHLGDGALLATTALALPVRSVAEGLVTPGRLAGLRFFPSPADARIAEVVAHGPRAGESTGTRSTDGDVAAAAVATLHEMARRVGVPALVVADAPGGLLHRLALAYVCEGIALVAAGADIADVDASARDAGLRDGPLRLADGIGLPALARLAGALQAEEGTDCSADALLGLVRREVVGEQAGRGFYSYRAGRPPRPSPDVPALLRDPASTETPAVTGDEMAERLRLALLNEAARALDAGIVATPGEIDLAVMLGFGFPAHLGGLLFDADRRGLAAVAARMEALAETAGPRLRPAPLLRRLADAGASFHGAPPAGPGSQAEATDGRGQGAPDGLP